MDLYWGAEGALEAENCEQQIQHSPIVLHLGSRFARIGPAGVHTPHLVVDAPFARPDTPVADLSVFSRTGFTPDGPQLVGNLVASNYTSKVISDVLPSGAELDHEIGLWLWRSLSACAAREIQKHLVLIVDGPLLSLQLKHKIVELLLNLFLVPGVFFISDLISPIYICGVDTSLVVDLGYSCCRVQPTYSGSALSCGLRFSNVGARAILLQLQRELLAAAETQQQTKALACINLKDLEDIAVKALYVRYEIETEQDGEKGKVVAFESDAPLKFTLRDGTAVSVSAETRWRCTEILFDGLSPEEVAVDIGDGIVCLIIDSLLACPVETRRLCIQNILLCGGAASFRGLTTRLAGELHARLLAEPRCRGLAAAASFGVPPSPPNLRQWTGGSLHAMLHGNELYTRHDWTAGKPLPDWSASSRTTDENSWMEYQKESECPPASGLPQSDESASNGKILSVKRLDNSSLDETQVPRSELASEGAAAASPSSSEGRRRSRSSSLLRSSSHLSIPADWPQGPTS